jgi:nicotinate phosphoribosyltransferase
VEELSLATDLYQLTMAAAYQRRWGGQMPRASFEFFVRGLPEGRNFLIFTGLEQLLGSLQELRFTADQIDYLRHLPPFAGVEASFFAELARFRFQGDVWAMPEGTVFFPAEPAVRVTGTLLEAQLVETLLLSILNFQCAIASKAARIRLVAGTSRASEGPPRSLAEFGGRRAHGPTAAAWVARAAYLAGFESTSNLLAGHRLGIPVVGTMAHSYVMSFDREIDAFRHYFATFPANSILLVDTYDTLEGVRQALATELPFQGIRLDSGDLAVTARKARALLDAAGRPDVQIFASSDLDEYRIAHLLEAGAPIDAFGVGTRLAACADTPYVAGVYKLVAQKGKDGWKGRFKRAEGKPSYPGRKQVYRRLEGTFQGDRVVAETATPPAMGEGWGALLKPVMRRGEVLHSPSLEEAREHCRTQLAALPAPLRHLETAEEPYPVEIQPQPLPGPT